MLGFCTKVQLDNAYRALSIDRNMNDDMVLERYENSVSDVIMIYEESMPHMPP
jgi:hypothetical protein